MNKLITVIFLILISLPVISQNNDAEIEAIKNVIQTAYVEGLQNEADIDKIDKGFHPDFNLLGIEEGNKMWKLSIEDWKKRVIKGKEEGKYPKADDKKVSIKFLFVDVTGNAAVAKFEFYVGDELKYIDYQSLYKFEDGWKIVVKTFHKM
jgi:hypothetical protein